MMAGQVLAFSTGGSPVRTSANPAAAPVSLVVSGATTGTYTRSVSYRTP